MSGLIGRTLGRYQILEALGEGGMATVFKAYDTRLGRYVALKVMRPLATPQPALMRRFELEARALASLAHPAIVRVLDYGEHDGWPYLVLEMTPGGTLRDWLPPGPDGSARPLAWREAARFLLPIARALEFAHQRGIIHRDVKPGNILLTESGQPMLSDFGIAKTFENEGTTDLTAVGVRLGTPEYMSPEQCLGQPVDYRTDIYSLGAVFYEMVTGRKPFTADSPMAVMHRQIYDPLPPPRRANPGLPPAVEDVLYRAMAKGPGERYQNMGEFASALEDLARGEPTGESQGVAPFGPARPARRAWLARALLGAGLLLALLAVYALANRARPGLIDPPGQAGTAQPTAADTAAAATATAPQAAADWRQGRLAFTRRQGDAAALFTLDLNGGQPDMLYAGAGRLALGAAWSPDGRQIAYYLYPVDLMTVEAGDEDSVEKVGECNSPSWSGDSRRVVCRAPEGRDFLIVDTSNGTVSDRFPADAGAVPAWSPVRDEIVYAVFFEGSLTRLYRMSLDTLEPVPLAVDGTENYAPSFSPDGQWIAYQSDAGSADSEIWVMDRDGQNQRQVTTTPEGGWSRAPAWSPDGQWLAFVSGQAGSAGADYGEIFVVSLQTGEVVQVTQTGGQVYDWRVSWSR